MGRDICRDLFPDLRLDPAPQLGCSTDPTQRPLCEHSQTRTITLSWTELLERCRDLLGRGKGWDRPVPQSTDQTASPSTNVHEEPTEPTPSEQRSQQELCLSCCTLIPHTHMGHRDREECFWAGWGRVRDSWPWGPPLLSGRDERGALLSSSMAPQPHAACARLEEGITLLAGSTAGKRHRHGTTQTPSKAPAKREGKQPWWRYLPKNTSSCRQWVQRSSADRQAAAGSSGRHSSVQLQPPEQCSAVHARRGCSGLSARHAATGLQGGLQPWEGARVGSGKLRCSSGARSQEGT